MTSQQTRCTLQICTLTGDTYSMSQKNVLIVEDDPFLAGLIVDQLSKVGIANHLVGNAEDALDYLAKNKPDIILLDILLPGMNGFVFLEGIRRKLALLHIPVIILSNLGQKNEIDRGVALGAIEYMIKAEYTLDQIIEKVQRILALPSQSSSP